MLCFAWRGKLKILHFVRGKKSKIDKIKKKKTCEEFSHHVCEKKNNSIRCLSWKIEFACKFPPTSYWLLTRKIFSFESKRLIARNNHPRIDEKFFIDQQTFLWMWSISLFLSLKLLNLKEARYREVITIINAWLNESINNKKFAMLVSSSPRFTPLWHHQRRLSQNRLREWEQKTSTITPITRGDV